MNSQQASEMFKSADALFKQAQYQQALDLLSQLDALYPNSKNILYPMALCLERLGRLDEAEQLSEKLATKFQHPQAAEIKARIAAARGDATDEFAMPGLDGMDLLGDFDAPKPKRTAPRPQPASDLPKKIVTGAIVAIAACAIVALGIIGAQKGWFKSKADTLESVEAKLIEFVGSVDSLSAAFDGSAEFAPMPQMNMKVSINSTVDCLMQGNQTLFRMEGASNAVIPNMPPIDSPFVLVCNGTDMFIEQTTMGMTMAIQQPMPTAMAPTSGNLPKELLKKLHAIATLKLMKSELLDGEEAYVIQATPLPGQEQDLALPGGKKLASITIYIAKTMSQIRLVAADDAGAQIASVALKDILTNLPFESSRFTYAPPSGVAVMKMEDLIKQMPGGMPGMPAMPK